MPPQDPHLSFPFGGTADFRGRDGQHYCFLSAPRLAINIKTEDATFQLHNLHDKGGMLDVDGSFITEVHFVARVGGRKNKPCLASFWAGEVNEFNTGFNMVNGTCGGGPFFVGTGASKRCEEMLIAVRFSSAEFTIGDWVALVRANWVYGHISGPAHRLDVSLRARPGGAPPAARARGTKLCVCRPAVRPRRRVPRLGHLSDLSDGRRRRGVRAPPDLGAAF